MFARVAGKGTAVLLLHGAPSASEALRSLAHSLVSHHKVVIPDLPGYGFTPAPRVRSLAEERDELVATLRRLGITRLHAAIGNSLGAYRALDLALSSDITVERLGFLAGYGDLPQPHRASLRALAEELSTQTAFGDEFATMIAERAVCSAFLDQNRALVRSVLGAALRNTTPAALSAELVAMAESPNLLPAAAAFDGPCAIRVGELDAMTPSAYSVALGDALRTPATIVPGVGHALLVEDIEASEAQMLALVRT